MNVQNDQFSPDMVAEEETLQPFDVRDSSGRQGIVKLLIGAAMLLVSAFLLLKFYQPGVRDRDAPPRITAENTPFKVEPEDPEGMQVPNQDRGVFDVMDGNAPKDVVTEIIAAEAPLKLPETSTSTNQPTESLDDSVTENNANQRELPPPVPVQARASTNETNAISTGEGVARTGSSNFVVQVASLRSQADAQATWVTLERRFSDVLDAGLYADIKRVDLDEKGVYYRTRVAGLADRAAANALCERFKAANQACFVTRR